MPKSRAIACEEVAGRANVEDTPELLAYYDQLEQLEAGALWTVANTIEPWQPKSSSVPVLWRYRDLRDHVLRSLDLVTPEKAGRRVIYLNNPGRRGVSAVWAGSTPAFRSCVRARSPRPMGIRLRHCGSSWKVLAPTRL